MHQQPLALLPPPTPPPEDDLQARIKALRARLDRLGPDTCWLAQRSLNYAERELQRSRVPRNKRHAVKRAEFWVTAAEELPP